MIEVAIAAVSTTEHYATVRLWPSLVVGFRIPTYQDGHYHQCYSTQEIGSSQVGAP